MSKMTRQEQPQGPSNQTLLMVIGVLIAAIAVVGLYIVFDRLTETPPTDVVTSSRQNIVDQDDYDGSTRLDPPREMPDFTLTSHTGEPLSLSALRGQPVLLTFGFTHCPDICPLTLNEFKQIQGSLGEAGDEVHFVFISVDGQRDTPRALRQYFEVRGIDDFIGLTGPEADLRRLGVDYGLYFETSPNPNSNDPNNYLVDHTAGAFLLDEQGRWVYRYAFGTATEVIVDDLQNLLAG